VSVFNNKEENVSARGSEQMGGYLSEKWTIRDNNGGGIQYYQRCT